MSHKRDGSKFPAKIIDREQSCHLSRTVVARDNSNSKCQHFFQFLKILLPISSIKTKGFHSSNIIICEKNLRISSGQTTDNPTHFVQSCKAHHRLTSRSTLVLAGIRQTCHLANSWSATARVGSSDAASELALATMYCSRHWRWGECTVRGEFVGASNKRWLW